MIAGRLGRSGLALVLMAAALLGVQAQPDKPKEPGQKPAANDENVVTADKVKALQSQFQTERAAADKAGLTKVFSPECYEKADALAKQGDTALSANHLATAVTRFRGALRQLPSLPPNLPPHVVRIFGDGRWRHAFSVNAVAFSPDGKYLASGGEDGMIKVFDPATSKLLACFSAHEVGLSGDPGGVRAVAFSPDSTTLASAGKGDVKLWDPKTGKEIKSLKGNSDLLDCLAYSPDGKTLAAGGKEKKLFLWNTTSGELKAELQGHNALIKGVAFGRDGKKMASVSEDGILRTYDLTKPGEKPFDLVSISHFKGAHALAFDLDGLNVYVGGYEPNAVKLISAADGSERRIFEGFPKEYGVTCMALSKDGRTLATSFGKQNIRLWDTASGQPFRTLTGHSGEVRSLAFSPDGLYLASGSADQSVRLWALGGGEQHRSLAGQGIIWSSAFSPDGKRLVTAGADRIVRVWDTRTDKELLALKGHKAAVTEARFSPDGKYILSCGGDKVLRLWNADDGSEVRVFEGHTAPVTSAAFSPDGKQIVSGSADRTARIWDTATGRVLHTLVGHRAVVSSVAWSRDGKHIATGSADHTARLWDAEGKLERILKDRPHTGAVSAVAFSPDNRWLATCGGDHLIKLWSVDVPGEPTDFIGHEAVVSSIAFSPDSKVLASAGADEVVKLWDVATHNELQGFRGHTNWISSVAFSADGHFLTSAGVDKTVRVWELSGRDSSAVDSRDAELRALAVSPDGKLLAGCGGPVKDEKGDNIIRVWDLATGRELQTLIGHQDTVWSLAFLPDSKTLVSVGNDKQVRVWDTTTGKEQRAIELPDRDNVNEVPVLLALPDGKQVQAWLAPTQVAVLDVSAGKRELLSSLVDNSGSGGDVSSLNFSLDGTLAVFGDKNGVARVWDKASGKLLGSAVNAHSPTEITDLILTPDKKTLVTGDKEGQVKVWDLAKRTEPLHSFKAHQKYIYAIAMSPDGKRFASIGEDNIIKLWDVKTAKELRRWDLKRPAVNNRPFCRTLVFTPDSKGLVTANADTTAYLLDCTEAK